MPSPAELSLMARALRLAEKAAALGEVPVGALVVQGPLDAARPKVLARAHNRTEGRPDPTAHAERLVIERAARKLGRWRLNDCTLIVTLEPCAMCAGAAVWARMGRIIYGAPDPKAGACGSVLQVADHPRLNHRIPVTGGVLQDDCGRLLKRFFQAKRMKGKP
ncbi:MAG TPA: tRNA adenosine(34) deaminase TadA [bacterium]|nr:tRNA adenosine(34) deaminase TadA [bacterium]